MNLISVKRRKSPSLLKCDEILAFEKEWTERPWLFRDLRAAVLSDFLQLRRVENILDLFVIGVFLCVKYMVKSLCAVRRTLSLLEAALAFDYSQLMILLVGTRQDK